MVEYKSSLSRMARLFKESREAWKEKALERQKRLRAFDVKVRDITKSRDKWKEKTKELEERVKQLEKEVEKQEAKAEKAEKENEALIMKNEDGIISSKPVGHRYPSHVILLGIEQVMYGLASLRGSERNFELFSKFFDLPNPSFNSMRSWIFRLGLYLMQSKCERGEDWILILDHTVELGQKKCLLILGIREGQLKAGGYALQHQDVTVLEIDVVTHSTGEKVVEQIEKVAEKVGMPKQILADYGSDIKKGVHLYQKMHPTVIYTYDVTHKMAALLKKELQKDEKWLSFLKQCGKACTGLKQTNLYFLAPPRQRSKARYSNVVPQIQWAQKIIAYQQQGDYSQIDPTYTLDQQTIEAVQDEFGHETALLLTAIPSKTYTNRDAFTRGLVVNIGDTQIERIQAVVYPAADRGRRRFNEKLAWVTEYQEELTMYAQMVDLIDLVQTQVKQDGLNQASHQRFEENTGAISLLPRSQSLAEQISDYLRFEGQQIPDQQTLLGTSDAIESVIGKYKYLSAESPMRDVGKMILTIPVFTTKLTCELVKTAMESVQALDVDKWADNLLGKSALSKRRTLSCAPIYDTKSA